MISGNQALRIEIDEMRLMRHPAKQWEIECKHGEIRAIERFMSPDRELVSEALAELDALRKEQPAKPYERREEFAVPS